MKCRKTVHIKYNCIGRASHSWWIQFNVTSCSAKFRPIFRKYATMLIQPTEYLLLASRIAFHENSLIVSKIDTGTIGQTESTSILWIQLCIPANQCSLLRDKVGGRWLCTSRCKSIMIMFYVYVLSMCFLVTLLCYETSYKIRRTTHVKDRGIHCSDP
jgi:hypothetical protein